MPALNPKPRRPAAAAPRDTLGSQIRQAAAARRLSAGALAADSGLDRRLVSRFLAGAKDVTLSTADRLCAALGLRLVESGRKAPRPLPSATPPARPDPAPAAGAAPPEV